jgi:hypothetical protein
MAPDVLVLRNAMDSAARTRIGIVSDPDTDDPDMVVEQAYEESQFDAIMPGEHELYGVVESCTTNCRADHLEAPDHE